MPCPYPKCSSTLYSISFDRILVCSSCRRCCSHEDWFGESGKRGPTYSEGTYGARAKSQNTFGVNGTTHEAEHPIPYSSYSPFSRGKMTVADQLENVGWAYQEAKEFHRLHPGTGSSGISQEYRANMRQLTGAGRVSGAIQLSQLEYAYLPGFRGGTGAHLQVADLSYRQMLQCAPEVPLVDDSRQLYAHSVSAIDRAEMDLARIIARRGSWSSPDEEKCMLAHYQGLQNGSSSSSSSPKSSSSSSMAPLSSSSSSSSSMFSSQSSNQMSSSSSSSQGLGFWSSSSSPSFNFDTDENGIPKDGDCLFHCFAAYLRRTDSDWDWVTANFLRQVAVRALASHPIFGQDLDYLRRMAMPRTWAGQLELFALSVIFRFPCVIHMPGQPDLTMNAGSRSPFQFHFYYANHHWSVAPFKH